MALKDWLRTLVLLQTESEWTQYNLQCLKAQFLHLTTRYNLPYIYSTCLTAHSCPTQLYETLSACTFFKIWKGIFIAHLSLHQLPRYQAPCTCASVIFPDFQMPIKNTEFFCLWPAYVSLVRGFHPHSSLDRVKGIPTYQLHSFYCRPRVASLVIFHRYFHAGCPLRPANCNTSLVPRSRYTLLVILVHTCSVQLVHARVNQYFYVLSLSLARSVKAFLPLHFTLHMAWTTLEGEYRCTSPA